MKIVFMGTPEFAVPALQTLIDSSHEVTAVYCQPPRPAGRGYREQKSPVHMLAEKHSIPVFTPITLKNEQEQQQMCRHKADIAVVAAYGLLLPKAVLEAFPHGCINIHPSKLPRMRGAAPIQRTIMAGDKDTAMCIMQMDTGLDTGDVLLSREVSLTDTMTAGDLHDIMAELGAKLTLQTLDAIANGTAARTPQPEDGATYAHKIRKEETHINWSQPASVVNAHIRGLSPWPGAYFEYNGERYKILRCTSENHGNMPAGIVIDDRLSIACTQGCIHPLLIQRQGKKPMDIDTFLKGNAIPEGTKVL